MVPQGLLDGKSVMVCQRAANETGRGGAAMVLAKAFACLLVTSFPGTSLIPGVHI